MGNDGSQVVALTSPPEQSAARFIRPVWSPDGSRIAYVSGRDVHWVAADGSGGANVTNRPDAINISPSWSPDGTRIAFESDRNGNPDIFVTDLAGAAPVQVTNGQAQDKSPGWLSDAELVFGSDRSGVMEPYVVEVGNPGSTQLLEQTDVAMVFAANRDGNAEIYSLNVGGPGIRRLTNNTAHDSDPVWSPDRSRIAFISQRDGNPEVYLMNNDGSGQVNLSDSPNYDGYPTWSPDGSRLAFASNRGGYLAIHIVSLPAVVTAAPEAHSVSRDPAETHFAPAWSPLGDRIAFLRFSA